MWEFEDYWWGFALEIVVLLYSFAGLALVCDDYMVPALETLCVRWNVQEDVAGATFMAFGSAAPEIIINAVQTIKSRMRSPPSDAPAKKQDAVALGIGAIIGSGMIAFMIIPAICAIFSDQALMIKRRPFARDAGFYCLALLLTIMFLQDENIMCYEAAILVGMYICYVLTVVFGHSVREKYLAKFKGLVLERQDSFVLREKEKRKSRTPSTTMKSDIKTPLLQNSSSPTLNKTQNVTRHSPHQKRTLGSPLDDGAADFWSSKENVGEVENQGLLSGGTKDTGVLSMKQLQKDSKPVYPVSPMSGETIQQTGAEGHCEESDEEDESCWSLMCVLTSPLKFLFMITCPKAVHGESCEFLYPLAFVVSFCWIAAFSFIISEVVEEWVVKTGINEAFFGLTLIAIGAEIPDTIQSVTVARRGYGSMAVSNCIGSQIVNLTIGLGFSWLLGIVASNMEPVMLTKLGVRNVFDAAVCQGVAVLFCLCLLFAPIVYSRFNQKKLYLGKVKGYMLLFTYLATLGAFGIIEYLQGAFVSTN